MTTLEKERIDELYTNVLEGLMDGYNELKSQNPSLEQEFQKTIESLQKQLKKVN